MGRVPNFEFGYIGTMELTSVHANAAQPGSVIEAPDGDVAISLELEWVSRFDCYSDALS
jgi:hypothetical protein